MKGRNDTYLSNAEMEEAKRTLRVGRNKLNCRMNDDRGMISIAKQFQGSHHITSSLTHIQRAQAQSGQLYSITLPTTTMILKIQFCELFFIIAFIEVTSLPPLSQSTWIRLALHPPERHVSESHPRQKSFQVKISR